jgi:hypothetical protein
MSNAATIVHRTWEAETTEACIAHANEIANTMQVAQSTRGTNIPPVLGYRRCDLANVDSACLLHLLYIYMGGTGISHKVLPSRKSF